ncbi:MAG: response regulator [Sulfurimonas sp.]|uniref:response regulator n=1 Tax=Sulfurimonas sp. TaxID=2022749 RepID=UPI0025F28FFA|nr:response regulator [Sulfurimonas sp.]MCK9491591.1 response regulator [Sulfurimonas sp.]
MKILFVDDNELNRIVLNDMIEILFEDVNVETYESANDVLGLEISSYDLILSDIDMPEINGFELHDILRKEHNFLKPIIAVTALAVSGDKEKMLMHGFNDYISKPIDMNELESTLQKYI